MTHLLQGTTVTVQVPPIPPIPPVPPMPDIIQVLPPWMVMPPQVVALVSIAAIAGAALVLYPLARAIARRFEGRGVSPELQQQVEELRDRVHDLEASQHRVAELEERLDFTERLLAQRRDIEQIPRS
jgi:Tfp pilus assembly protein PilO